MQTFKKEERLCSKKHIRELFENGSGFFRYPFKIVWNKKEGDFTHPAQVLISVSKRNFKHAVDRNKVKRLIREAYRKNKSPLYQFLEEKNAYLDFAFIYTSKKIASYQEIEKRVIQAIERLIENYEKATH